MPANVLRNAKQEGVGELSAFTSSYVFAENAHMPYLEAWVYTLVLCGVHTDAMPELNPSHRATPKSYPTTITLNRSPSGALTRTQLNYVLSINSLQFARANFARNTRAKRAHAADAMSYGTPGLPFTRLTPMSTRGAAHKTFVAA